MKDRKAIVAKEIRGNNSEEIERSLAAIQDELFKNRLKKATNQLENTALLRSARRDIARLKTVLGELSRGVPLAAASPKGR